ncbi:MAG: cation:proton antiporter [Tannerella sp.]|jgi:Kef-type K+ transport system membrane component KefB|nr:cation:proton antiporter [Tannerella sp.]
MILTAITNVTLPLTDPILKFLVILVIILAAPILLRKLKIPSILGLIISGAIIGPNGINLMERDGSIILSGTAGLLYIMFLAGLDIDLADFKKNSSKSILFGLYTFSIPLLFGFVSGFYILHFSLNSSLLLASMFASHTLIAYPIISRYGITKNRAVTIAVGGTLITDTLSLLVLASVVGMTTGEVNSAFWIRIIVSTIIAVSIIAFLFPVIARWFLKRFKDRVSQYIFVLAMVFFGAVLSELAGIEGIVGAFLAGLSLNKLIPSTSPLMNRIEFVGNAIFIPFFLIGVGMLVDYRAFFSDFQTIKVALLLTFIAIASKYIASWITQKSFKYTPDERNVIFGLSNARVAATLAIVTVGYNIILGHAESGEPVRLLSQSVLDGTIVMILITCTVASFAAQKGARKISLLQSDPNNEKDNPVYENFLISLSHPDNIDELINLSMLIKKKDKRNSLYALNVINNKNPDPGADKKSREILEKAQIKASAADVHLNTLLRYDRSVPNAIMSVIKETQASDLILGLHIQYVMTESFLGNLTENILENSNVTTYIYRSVQPVSTIRRHIVVIPQHAETELGFPFWVVKMWRLALNTGSKLIFYGAKETINILKDVHQNNHIEAEFNLFNNWDDFLVLKQNMQKDDNMVIVMSRRNKTSYQSGMKNIPNYLNKYFTSYNFMLIYPMQLSTKENNNASLLDASILASMEIGGIGKAISKILKVK